MDITTRSKRAISTKQGIALVAHDQCKLNLLDWAASNKKALERHPLYATGTTGQRLQQELNLDVTLLQSGPLGGDQQIGAKIVDREIGFLVFFWDPLKSQPHDPDVRALLRLAVLWNVPMACNRATADLIIASNLLQTDLSHAENINQANLSGDSLAKLSPVNVHRQNMNNTKSTRSVRSKIKSSKKKTRRFVRA